MVRKVGRRKELTFIVNWSLYLYNCMEETLFSWQQTLSNPYRLFEGGYILRSLWGRGGIETLVPWRRSRWPLFSCLTSFFFFLFLIPLANWGESSIFQDKGRRVGGGFLGWLREEKKMWGEVAASGKKFWEKSRGAQWGIWWPLCCGVSSTKSFFPHLYT